MSLDSLQIMLDASCGHWTPPLAISPVTPAEIARREELAALDEYDAKRQRRYPVRYPTSHNTAENLRLQLNNEGCN